MEGFLQGIGLGRYVEDFESLGFTNVDDVVAMNNEAEKTMVTSGDLLSDPYGFILILLSFHSCNYCPLPPTCRKANKTQCLQH